MNNKIYDILKWTATTFLPALTLLWLALGSLWGIPYVEPIAGTIAAVNAFLGTLVGISAVNYAKNNK